MITQEYLKTILHYNEITGVFTWLKPRASNKVKIGNIAGSINKQGYSQISIGYKKYKAHRLAWIYVHGNLPNIIDHIDGNTLNNSIINLRNVTSRKNSSNSKNHRNGKLIGAHFHKQSNKWRSYIYINNKQEYLGVFKTELEAHNTYINYLNNGAISCN